MKKRRSRTPETGLTLAELLIVISIIGIIAAIALPRFIEQKDRATLGTTFANLNAMRSCLSQYAIGSDNNQYPDGPLNYAGLIATVPECNMPPLESGAKIAIASFGYSSDKISYAIYATSSNRSETRFLATPTGIVHN